MIIYIIKSAIILGMLYSCYYILLNKETFHRFNRLVLVGIMLLSLGLPLMKTTTEQPTAVNTEIYTLQTRMVEPIAVSQQHHKDMKVETEKSVSWGDVISIIYNVGVGISVLVLVVQILFLYKQMRVGLRHTDSEGNTVILQSGKVAPYSIFRFIVMSVEDYEHNRTSILTHEQEHIRLHHTYDLMLFEAVKALQWFNPFVWFLGTNLKAVHEYEADEAVINQGIDAKQYQQLLVTKAVGNRLQPFANNLRRGSLKKRIIMMYQKKSKRSMMLKALFVIPVIAIAIFAFATPKFVKSNKNTTEVADTCGEKRGIYLLTPEEFANVNETPEDSFLLDGKYISFEKFKKIDMDSIAYIGIFSTSKEDRMKQISGEHKGRSFYVFSKKKAEEGKLMKYYNIDIRVNRQDRIMLDTDYVNLSDLSDSIKKQVNYPDRTIAYLQVSEKASQSTVSAIKDVLRENGILNVIYSVYTGAEK